MINGARSSSYDCEVSANVYRMADITVALVAAFLSPIRACCQMVQSATIYTMSYTEASLHVIEANIEMGVS
jgi:hypothetical protein